MRLRFTHLFFQKANIVFGLLLVAGIPAHAQERPYRQYKTQTVQRNTAKQFPDFENELILMENVISNYAARGDDGRILMIPVIFHVLTSEGFKFPDREQINLQLKLLNEHFGGYNPAEKEFPNEDIQRYAALAANPGIQFYLPNETATFKPIQFLSSKQRTWGFENEIFDPSQGGLAPVEPKSYVNVYIAALDSNMAGYAHLPAAPLQVDGIVIDPHFFGNSNGTAVEPYNQGKTLAHLMGVYLGLYELWNEAEPCKDDNVPDTPLHDIPTTFVSIKTDTRRVCFCPGTPTAMYTNFMDNTDDALLNMFTNGQKQRMRAVLLSESLRSGLVKK